MSSGRSRGSPPPQNEGRNQRRRLNDDEDDDDVQLIRVVRSSDAERRYFCHACRERVRVRTNNSQELQCRLCNNTFVEEISTNENGLSNILEIMSNSSDSHDEDLDGPEGIAGMTPFPFGPSWSILIHQTFDGISRRGGPGNLSFNLPNNSGDIFLSGFDILSHLFQMGGPSGPPPAAKSAIEALKKVSIKAEDLPLECVVCQDDFELGIECTEMPCKHKFHHACLAPWLEKHNTCPVCRGPIKSQEEADRENNNSNDRQPRRRFTSRRGDSSRRSTPQARSSRSSSSA